MIRFSKILFTNPAHICVSGIKCSHDNIIKMVNIFDHKYILLTVDSVTEESSLLTFIKSQSVKYSVKQHTAEYMEISVVVPCDLFSLILEKAILEDPENIFIFNLLDPLSWNRQLHCSFEKLVATGTTDMFISISLDENALSISLNKSLLRPREVYRKIRALRFE